MYKIVEFGLNINFPDNFHVANAREKSSCILGYLYLGLVHHYKYFYNTLSNIVRVLVLAMGNELINLWFNFLRKISRYSR